MNDADFSMVAGDAKVLRVIVKQDGEPYDLTDATAVDWFAALMPFDQSAVITKAIGNGINYTDRPNGKLDITLDPADTVGLDGSYFHYARVYEDEGPTTIFLGVMNVAPIVNIGIATVDVLLARFPEFSGVNRTVLQMVLNEALAMTEDWCIDADRLPATLYLAAHLLTMEGEPGRSAAAASGNVSTIVSGPVKRRKVGDVETEFAGASVVRSDGTTGYESTTYGQQYLFYLGKCGGSFIAVV